MVGGSAAAAPALVLTMTRYEEQPKRVSRIACFVLALLLFVTLRPENVAIALCAATALGVLFVRESEHRWRRSAVWLTGASAALTLGRLIAFWFRLATHGGRQIRCLPLPLRC